jgi:hypothetical protein
MSEVVHPADVEVIHALVPVVVAIVLLLVSVHFGMWDKFLEVAVGYFPLWNWGG